MSESLEQLIARLRVEYLTEVPGRLAEMRVACSAWLEHRATAGPPVTTLFHRLAGSAGAYGFGDVSTICRETERWLATGPEPSPEHGRRVEAAIAAIAAAFAKPPTTAGLEG
jgi:HPt (histidine-containing phosphotransfer) domain-containing protein